jgi:phage terminase large subunit-like protein
MSSEAEAAALVQELARLLRQSFQTCSSHSIGPVASFARCIELARAGRLTAEDLRAIAERVVDQSRSELQAIDGRPVDERERSFLRRRERQVVDFTRSLFSLDTVEQIVDPRPRI